MKFQKIAGTWIVAICILLLGCSNNKGKPDAGPDGGDTDTDTDTGAYVPQDCKGIVVFPDPAMEDAVRRSLAVYTLGMGQGAYYDGDLTAEIIAEAYEFVMVIGDYDEIEFLGGVECFVNARTLSLSHNKISDIFLLEYLPQLESVNIGYNEVADLSTLSSLANLKSLYIRWNPVESMAPVGELEGLVTLQADGIGIDSLEWVTGLTNLTGLWVSDNGIQDISPLAALTTITTLDLSNNQITDIGPLASVKIAYMLLLQNNQVSDISALSNSTDLAELHLDNNDIADIGPLAGLTNLYCLKLHNNRIDDIGPLAGIAGLYSVTLWNNEIVDLSPLVTTEFSQTDFPYCNTADYDYLAYNFSDNKISDVTPLASFTGPPAFGISRNEVTDISPLAGKSIGYLNAEDNDIHSLLALITLGDCAYLNLTNNRVSSVGALTANARVLSKNSDRPYWEVLLGNPLDAFAIDEHIPVICEHNIEVYWGDEDTCDWNDNPIVLPSFDPDPDPWTGVEVQPEDCSTNQSWLADGALPSEAHGSPDFTIEETVAGEPIVVDQITGLEWRRCSAGQTWSGSSCAGTADLLSYADANAACGGGYGGQTDWRLADVTELASLVDYSTAYPGPVLDSVSFPGTYPGSYWTSTEPPKSGGAVAWQVNFYNGTVDINLTRDSTNNHARVRCVRGGQPAAPPVRFDNTVGDGSTVLDNWSGLEWVRCANGQTWSGTTCTGAAAEVSWGGIQTACDGTFSGHSDWRVPTVVEIASLVNFCGADAAEHSAQFPETTAAFHWSSTVFPDYDAKLWMVDFNYGWTEPGMDASTARVRCVR